MSYEKQTWANGDTITAEKLNHMESGIEDSSGGGYDGVILITYPETSDPPTITVESGTYAGLFAKYNEGEFVAIKVITISRAQYSCGTMGFVDAAFDSEESRIVVSYFDGYDKEIFSLIWTSDDTVAFAD